MKTFVLSVLLFCGGVAFAAANQPFKMMSATELQKNMEAKKDQVYVYDANTNETRQKDGLIPGAKPLANVTSYDAKTVLPADKTAMLVFYCANTQCTASHEAAKVAMKAGYTNVAVMSDGIQGWKKAGMKTEKYATP